MHIERLDPTDDSAWSAWHRTYLMSDTFERPSATPFMSNELRMHLLNPTSGIDYQVFTGVDDGDVVTTGWLEFPLKDNLEMALIDVQVLPERRGQGLGARMLNHLEELAAEAGRSTLLIEMNYPFELGPEGKGHHGVEFLRNRGYHRALENIRREVPLPVDGEFLAGLRAEAEPFHAGYTFRQFAGRCPDDIVDELGDLLGRIETEAPTGDLDLEEELFDADRIREDEKVLEAANRKKFTTVAIAPGGELVAFTELVVPAEDPGKAYQWGTLVVPEHRGHRLGMAVKVRNLEWVQSEVIGLRVVSTTNAEVNAQMVGINERLGFRPVERMAEFQKRLDL